MKRPAVRCRCGHQVLAKEVLRTDLYERPSGREYVYVKYRCQRCKRMGETFVAENRWDWRIFESARNELSESETEVFSEQAPISSEDLLDFHRQLAAVETAQELACNDSTFEGNGQESADEKGGGNCATDASGKTLRPEPKRADSESKKDVKKDTEITGRPEDGSSR